MDHFSDPDADHQSIDIQTYRIFNCKQCGTQCFVCSRCDRGNIYCQPCSTSARARRIKNAQSKYRRSKRGKLLHARSERERRARRPVKFVGDRGSTPAQSETQQPITPSGSEEQEKNSSGDGGEVTLCGGIPNFSKSNVILCHICGKEAGSHSRQLGEAGKTRRSLAKRNRRRGRPP